MEGSVIINTKHGKSFAQRNQGFVNEISQALPILGESGSEFSYFIPESRKFA